MLNKDLTEDRSLSYQGKRTLREEGTASAKAMRQEYGQLVGGGEGRQV